MASSALAARLERAFAVDEIEADPRLRVLLGALLFYGYFTFSSWYGRPGLSTLGTETFNYVPTWVLENLRGLIFLDQFWTKAYFYALSMLALGGVGSLLYRKSCLAPTLILALLFVSKAFYYLSDLRLMANFHHIHLLITFVFLISRSKLFFTRLALLACYELAALAKLSPSWLEGGYFNSVPDKLPLLPGHPAVVRAASVGVLLLEAAGPALWFSRSRVLRLGSIVAFLAFHAYSGLLVGHKYTSLMIPLVVGAFLRFDAPIQQGYRFAVRHWPSWLALELALLGGLVGFAIPGDVRLTAEGRYLGLFMFDGNRAVYFDALVKKGRTSVRLEAELPWRNGAILEDGTIESARPRRIVGEVNTDGRLESRFEDRFVIEQDGVIVFNSRILEHAFYRTNGDPYLYYFYGKELCRRFRPDRLSMRLRQQLDGRVEKVTVMDIDDFCSRDLSYSAFRHNEWILLEPPTRVPSVAEPGYALYRAKHRPFGCELPRGWSIDDGRGPEPGRGHLQLRAAGPDGAELTVTYYKGRKPDPKDPEAFLKAHSARDVARASPIGFKRYPGMRFERTRAGRREAFAVLPLQRAPRYFVIRYAARPESFDPALLEHLLATFYLEKSGR